MADGLAVRDQPSFPPRSNGTLEFLRRFCKQPKQLRTHTLQGHGAELTPGLEKRRCPYCLSSTETLSTMQAAYAILCGGTLREAAASAMADQRDHRSIQKRNDYTLG